MAPRSACATAMSYAERLSGKASMSQKMTISSESMRSTTPFIQVPWGIRCADSCCSGTSRAAKTSRCFCRMTLGMLSQYMV